MLSILDFIRDEGGSTSLENMLWIALFVLGVAGAVIVLKEAVGRLAQDTAQQIQGTN